MTSGSGDTRDRSLAHWSEARRTEMDGFYRVATLDYRELAGAWDWNGYLRGLCNRRSPARILDVACGSGKFPAALRTHTGLNELDGSPLVLDLLDPSAFSLQEARSSLAPPMAGGRDFQCTLQDLPDEAVDYDVVWAVHALYALPWTELAAGVEAFLGALGKDGLGFVAHATEASHYLSFYRSYLQSFRPDGTPFTSAEQLIDAFRSAGAEVEVRPLRYEQVIDDEAILEAFLQRCVFDSGLSLEAMRADAVLGRYLEERRGAGRLHRFAQEVSMLFIHR